VFAATDSGKGLKNINTINDESPKDTARGIPKNIKMKNNSSKI
jgi:hypothetical protein